MTPNPMQAGAMGAPASAPSMNNDVREFKEATDDAVQSAKQQLADVLDGVTQRARQYGRYADEQVQANPWAAVGIGFGVGMAMGMLLAIVARR